MITDLLLLAKKLHFKQQPKQKQKKNLIGSQMEMMLMIKKLKVKWVMKMMMLYRIPDSVLTEESGLINLLLLINMQAA